MHLILTCFRVMRSELMRAPGGQEEFWRFSFITGSANFDVILSVKSLQAGTSLKAKRHQFLMLPEHCQQRLFLIRV